jgi:hypothetical protein
MIVAVKVTAWPLVGFAGLVEMLVTIRSGRLGGGAVTVIVVDWLAVPPAPVQVTE